MLGFSIYIAMRQALLRDFDASLATQARAISTMVDFDHGNLSLDLEPDQLPEFSSPSSDRYFEIVDNSGKVVARSPSLVADEKGLTAYDSHHRLLPDAQLGRSVTIPFTVDNDNDQAKKQDSWSRSGTITVTAKPIDVGRTLQTLALLIAISSGAAVALLILLLWRVVVRGLHPLNQFATRIGSLSETDLHHRLESNGSPRELAPMVDTLNGLLSRLQSAFTREKAFSADVAHELRTPIAGLRATIEVARSRPRSTQEYEAAIDDCAKVVDQMDSMIEALLLMARGDAGQLSVQLRDTDISELLRSVWQPLAPQAESRGLKCTISLPDSCEISTDSGKLRIILHNLLNNAVSHANDGGTINVTAARAGENAIVQITNSGSRIATHDVPCLFERFWRGDTSRSDTADHSGLGLSLCHRLVTLLGGQIEIETDCGRDFVVRVTIPTARKAVPAKVTALAT
jgi:two-component system sensor histidine kinase QseC